MEDFQNQLKYSQNCFLGKITTHNQQEWGGFYSDIISLISTSAKGHFLGYYEKLKGLNLIENKEYLTLRSFFGCIGSNSVLGYL